MAEVPWWRRRSWADQGCVYFVGAPEVKRIKIGFSSNHPDFRLNALETGSPCELVPLGIVLGDEGRERRLHKRLASLRVRREWFDIGPDLIRFLDENILPWPEHLPSEDEVVAAREGCELDPCSFVEAMVLSGRPPHRLRLEWPKPDVNPEGRVPIQALARGFPEIRSYLLRTHRPPGSRREPTDEELLAMAAMP